MGTPAVLIRKSTKQVIKFGDYPRIDMLPFPEGELDPDLEWLIVRNRDLRPEYDGRLFMPTTFNPDMQALEGFGQHPEYPLFREYLITDDVEKRTEEEIVLSIENAEIDALNSIVGNRAIKSIIQSILTLYKKVDKLNLTVAEQEVATEIQSLAVALWNNDAVAKDKIAQLKTGILPSIDAQWQKSK